MARKQDPVLESPAFRQLMEEGCTVLRLHAATRLSMQAYNGFMSEVDLTMPQFATLASLYQEDSLSMSALAQLIGVDATTLTRNLRLLERRGLVLQDTAADDRRRRVVKLTPEGRKLFLRAVPLWQKAQAALKKRLGVAQIEILHKQLTQVVEKLRDL